MFMDKIFFRVILTNFFLENLPMVYLENDERGGGNLMSKLRALIFVEYADTRISNFAIEYLRKNKKVFLRVYMEPM